MSAIEPMPQETMPVMAADAEISLIGACLSGADVSEIIELVEPSDFYSGHHATIWAAIGRVHRNGQRPDVVAVRHALEAAGERHDPIRLFEMSQLAPLPTAAAYYAQQVAIASGLRELQEAGAQVAQLAGRIVDTPEALTERREAARQIIDEASRSRTLSKARRIAEVLPEVIDIAQNGRASMLGTPWSDIDKLIGGIAPGRLVIIGARPGIGKSLLGTNLALHFAHHHRHAVLLASMEMPQVEVVQRLTAAHASVNLSDLMNGTVSEGDWAKLAARADEVSNLPIVIVDDPGQTVQTMRREARNIQRVRDDLALIVVDYLQLMGTSGKRDSNRAQELAEVSRGLKLLARETGACVVAMAQVNREAARRGNDRPKQSDLRESGAIEADADQVILLHQPDDDVPEIEVIVDKNRHGPKGIRSLQVWGHYARLVQPTGWRYAEEEA